MGGVIGSTGSTKMLSFGILYLASLLFSCSGMIDSSHTLSFVSMDLLFCSPVIGRAKIVEPAE